MMNLSKGEGSGGVLDWVGLDWLNFPTGCRFHCAAVLLCCAAAVQLPCSCCRAAAAVLLPCSCAYLG